MGGTNPWYVETYTQSERDASLGLRVPTPLCLLATKLAAYRDRGAHDPLDSHDLEDIVALLLGHPSLVTHALTAPATRVALHVAAELAAIAARHDGGDLFEAHAGHDSASQQRGLQLWAALRELG